MIPSRNAYNPIIAYIGVVPDIAAAATSARSSPGHADPCRQGVSRIRAATDVGNVPMARAFARLGYATLEHQLDMKWG